MEAGTLTAPARRRNPLAAGLDWLRAHDPAYGALRRATRAALIMPAMFAITSQVIGNPVMATFVAFGSFAMLLLVDYGGPFRDRARAQASLGVTCMVLICVATLCAQATWLAVLGMAVVAFGIVFAGSVSSVLAGATTPLMLSFILPVSLAGPVSSMPDRVAGWGLAAAVSIVAILVLWPSPVRDPVRDAAIGACRALAKRLEADVVFMLGDRSPSATDAHRAAMATADEAVGRLHTAFFSAPYRPTGLSTDGRAVVRLVDELRWLNAIVLRSAPKGPPKRANREVCMVKSAAAVVLGGAADLLERPRRGAGRLRDARASLGVALKQLEGATTAGPPEESGSEAVGAVTAQQMVSALDPSFRAQELSFVVGQVAINSEYAAAAACRSWPDRLLGRQPEGLPGVIAAAGERAASRVRPESLWLHNSIRAGAALGLAVLVADVSSVQHGFWVAFATLSVLRSNALSTGQNSLRALLGTTAGFVIGGVLVYLIGTDTALLWALLPVVVLLAGMAPATVSFAAGQAAFTVTLLILFNLLAPAGWRIGLVRVEDIALGGAVSLLVGLVFWPRGAGVALGRALGDAYIASTRYLAQAVAFGASRGDTLGPGSPEPHAAATQAAAAARRLDDTFRAYLSERGSKPIPLAEVTGLVTGVAAVRLAGDAVVDLWDGCDVPQGDRSAAGRELLSTAEYMTSWYGHFASALALREPVPDPLARDHVADGRLIAAVSEDLERSGGEETATGVRVIWTGDHLDAVRRLQESLVPPARIAVTEQSKTPLQSLRESVA